MGIRRDRVPDGRKGRDVDMQRLVKARAFFVEDELPEEFGWFAWLTPEHQRMFRGELYDAALGRASGQQLLALIDAWTATAELDHSPETRDRLARNWASGRFAPVDEWLTTRHTA